MIRAPAPEYLKSFRRKGYVAIGWHELGDITRLKENELRAKLEEVYNDVPPKAIDNYLGSLRIFFFRIEINDIILTYDTEKRIYLVGESQSRPTYEPKAIANEYPNVIKVTWKSEINRDDLSVPAKNTLGSARAVFGIPPDVLNEIENLITNRTTAIEERPSEEAGYETLIEDLQKQAIEAIKDKLLKLSWDKMQDLVAGILRAAGYFTRVSQPGPDGGTDIEANVDGFGFRTPRIKVEVKHRPNEKINTNYIRGFIGGLRGYNVGLYVSTGGFTRDACAEAERAPTPVTLIDLEELVNLYIQYYDKLDSETKALLPLINIYWPG